MHLAEAHAVAANLGLKEGSYSLGVHEGKWEIRISTGLGIDGPIPDAYDGTPAAEVWASVEDNDDFNYDPWSGPSLEEACERYNLKYSIWVRHEELQALAYRELGIPPVNEIVARGPSKEESRLWNHWNTVTRRVSWEQAENEFRAQLNELDSRWGTPR